MALKKVCPDLWVVDHQQKIPVGFRMPARMVIVRLQRGGLCIYSPGPFDDETAAEVESLGPVEYVVAPNRYHHLHLPAAVERFPDADVLGVPGVEAKRPDVTFTATLGPAAPWGDELLPIPIHGMPGFNEVAFHHRPSGTLIVADLLFNLQHEMGFLASLYTRLTGVRGRVAQSWLLRTAIRDRAACAASCLRLLSMPFDRFVPLHGEVVETGAKPQVKAALAWIFKDLETPREPTPAAAVPEV